MANKPTPKAKPKGLNDFLKEGKTPPSKNKKLPSDADVIIKGYNDKKTVAKEKLKADMKSGKMKRTESGMTGAMVAKVAGKVISNVASRSAAKSTAKALKAVNKPTDKTAKVAAKIEKKALKAANKPTNKTGSAMNKRERKYFQGKDEMIKSMQNTERAGLSKSSRKTTKSK